MLPYFHAAGHLPYAKAAQLYLQDMRNLEKNIGGVEYPQFTEDGFFTARRTDKFFCDIHSDQTIEQTLMRSLSVEGPFKRGVTESVAFKWIKAVCSTKDVIEGIEKFCNVSFNKSKQHDDASDSRIKRDDADVAKLVEWLSSHNPFSIPTDAITSISTGVTGDSRINFHEAFEIGINSMKKINNLNFKELRLKRSDKCLPLITMSSNIKVDNEIVPIDPLLIFQRISIMKKSQDELQNYMKYELAPYPISIFDETGMRKNKKSGLYKIFSQSENVSLNDKSGMVYVVDGGTSCSVENKREI